MQGFVQQQTSQSSRPGYDAGSAQNVMQQYTRLILLSVEVVETQGLACKRTGTRTGGVGERERGGDDICSGSDDSNSNSNSSPTIDTESKWLESDAGDEIEGGNRRRPIICSPSGFTMRYTQSESGSNDSSSSTSAAATTSNKTSRPKRALALELLISYIGGVLGSKSSLKSFVEVTHLSTHMFTLRASSEETQLPHMKTT